MGGGKADASAKTPKASADQEQPPVTASTPATAVYSDWSFQAYPPMPPHGFFPSPVASSPQPHPYIWGAQHIMPPYGTPPYVMYPPGGLYPHPSMPPGSHPFSPYSMTISNGNIEASGAVPGGGEADGKSSEGKDRSPLKRSKGSLGSLNMITGKNNNGQGKPSGQPANGVFSQSGESGSDSSSEGSDANSQNDSQHKTSGGNESYDETSKNGNTARASQNGSTHTPVPPVLGQTMSIMPMPAAVAPGAVAGPTTNLNIGMDYWGAPSSSSIPGIRGKIPATAVGGAVVSGASSDLWLQDEREIKRQRRKQSNRESARRSRLRKQAECEELAQRAEVLKEENATLRTELNRIKSEYEQLLSQNNLLKEKLGETHQGRGDSSIGRNEHHSGENTKRFLDNSAKPAEGDARTE